MKILRLLLSLGVVASALAQTGLGGIPWTHDLSVEQIQLQFAGANASATAREYTIDPETDVTVFVTVKNRSSNPSLPFRLDCTAGGQSVGSVPGSSVPSQGEKQFSMKWKTPPSGKGNFEARLNFTSALPGGSKSTCSTCKSARGNSRPSYSTLTESARCSFPNSCTVGSMGSVCSCHPTADAPYNNSSKAAYVIRGEAEPKPPQQNTADGIDLQVDGCYTSASIAKMGTHDAFVTISNRGNRAHSGSIDVEVTVGSKTRTVTFRGGLKPGEVKTEKVEFTKEGQCKAVVDPKNSIRESNEENNRYPR